MTHHSISKLHRNHELSRLATDLSADGFVVSGWIETGKKYRNPPRKAQKRPISLAAMPWDADAADSAKTASSDLGKETRHDS